jgi:hypothetical protein
LSDVRRLLPHQLDSSCSWAGERGGLEGAARADSVESGGSGSKGRGWNIGQSIVCLSGNRSFGDRTQTAYMMTQPQTFTYLNSFFWEILRIQTLSAHTNVMCLCITFFFFLSKPFSFTFWYLVFPFFLFQSFCLPFFLVFPSCSFDKYFLKNMLKSCIKKLYFLHTYAQLMHRICVRNFLNYIYKELCSKLFFSKQAEKSYE